MPEAVDTTIPPPAPEPAAEIETVPPPPPVPPAPTFDPFADDPSEVNPFNDPSEVNPFESTGRQDSSDFDAENNSGAINIPPSPPPPPPPTFNPFENDPLPPTPLELSNEAPLSTKENNPFDEVNSDTNQTSVPLENIFNTPPPEAAPEDNFNPFDLPAEN